MEVEPVGGLSAAPAQPIQPSGVTAEIAQARAKLREQVPPDRWDVVMDEVRRLQSQEGMSPLSALQAVYARLASGWVPMQVRWPTYD